jgi:hypothetical protein
MSPRTIIILAAVAPAMTLATAASAAPILGVNNYGYNANAGSWRVDRHPRYLGDVNGDERADIVGFGNAGVYVSLSNGNGTFTQPSLVVNNFGYNAGTWRVARHPRFLAELDANEAIDIVGFGNAGVWTAMNNGNGGFLNPSLVVANFGYEAGTWRVTRHPRLMGDLNDDDAEDIVGFGNAGVWVSMNDGDGNFDAPYLALNTFGYDAGGWRVTRHPRMLCDVNADGAEDICGFGDAGLWIAINDGDGTFQSPYLAIDTFGYVAGGWRENRHPRFMGDLNDDGADDVVGFGDAGMYVAMNDGDGNFGQAVLALNTFGYVAGGWRVERHPRMLAELNGDGALDVVGFGNAGVYVALNMGNGTFQAPFLAVANYGYVAGGWRVNRHPRFMADVTGDGRDDIVGFGNDGVWVSINSGQGTFL